MPKDRSADVGLIVVAAGSSTRMGSGGSKVFRDLAGQPVLGHTLATIADWQELAAVVLVTRSPDRPLVEELARQQLTRRSWQVVAGGDQRRDSVANGLAVLTSNAAVKIVLVHDAARPLATRGLFAAVAQAAREKGAAMPALPLADTLRRQIDGGWRTVPREDLFAVQTPQGFAKHLLVRAHAGNKDTAATDDVMLVEALGQSVVRVAGEPWNLKITEAADLELARQLVAGRRRVEESMDNLVGLGHDLHRLEPEGPLRLGGVDVPAAVHAAGHSDGDALLHAVTDAILGAVGAGDIGQHFSDQDPAHRGRDSATMLARSVELAAAAGYRLYQLDATVHLERPRLSPLRDAMRRQLGRLLDLPLPRVSLKAKTGEGLGPVGEGRAVACDALVQLRRLADSPAAAASDTD